MNNKKFIKNILIEVIKSEQSKRGRKCSHNIEHYVDIIYMVLKKYSKWTDLKEDLHNNTYYKKYRLWLKQEIFQKTFEILITLLNKKIFNHKYLTKLYMDSSDIQNKNGFQDIGRSYKYKFKNATKINVIVDINGLPISFHICKANMNDTCLTLKTIDKIPIKIIKSRKYPKYLIVDKGYVSIKNKNNLKNKIILVYSEKKN